jgi:hypothetical protein
MRFHTIYCLCFLTFCGCASQNNAPHPLLTGGEWINIEYTCTTPNGELAATSRRDTAEDTTLPHSPLFNTLNTYLPASEIVPLPQDAAIPLTKTMCFEEMLELLLARQSLGSAIDTPQSLTLHGELIPNITGGDRFLTMNLAYQTDRKVTIPLTEFQESFKTAPETGKQYHTITTGLSAVVDAVDGDNVIMTYSAAPGTFLPSPFGPESITQIGDKLEFKTDTKKGTLVHSGPAIGMVTTVNDTTFTIDYGHSFGFTPLTCEVVFRPYSSPDGQKWLNNFNEAAEESNKTGSPMLVHFHDQWSGPNKTFLTEILPDPKVTDTTSRYIRVQVNTVNHPQLLLKYDVTIIPTVLIIDSHGKILKKISGLPAVDEFADVLKKIQAKKD